MDIQSKENIKELNAKFKIIPNLIIAFITFLSFTKLSPAKKSFLYTLKLIFSGLLFNLGTLILLLILNSFLLHLWLQVGMSYKKDLLQINLA